jgi:hypothetical protein
MLLKYWANVKKRRQLFRCQALWAYDGVPNYKMRRAAIERNVSNYHSQRLLFLHTLSLSQNQNSSEKKARLPIK